MKDNNPKTPKPAPQPAPRPKVITEKRDTGGTKIVHFSQGASPKSDTKTDGTNSTGPRNKK